MERRDEMVELIGRLGDGPDAGMAAVAQLKDLLDEERLVQVGEARRAGWSEPSWIFPNRRRPSVPWRLPKRLPRRPPG